MKVFKFGGASVRNAEAVKNALRIVQQNADQELILIISAMGKTTNAMEEVVSHYMQGNGKAIARLKEIEDFHLEIIKDLFEEGHPVYSKFNSLNAALREKLNSDNSENYDFEYDQIVCYGELSSTLILSSYFNENGTPNTLLDARQCIITDTNYREAHIDWETSAKEYDRLIKPVLKKGNSLFITQGFIGGTSKGFSTTLGREGSDFSAAIFAYLGKAEEVVIWKDVEGVMNADPKWLDNTKPLSLLSYRETIELAYYGATVIHPKTIKPLENANIPLRVKCFLDTSMPGTCIKKAKDLKIESPVFIRKTMQVLLSFSPKDFSFIVEKNISHVFSRLHKHKVKVNLIQNSALGLSVCVDNHPNRIDKLIEELNDGFNILYNDGLELITIRHPDAESKSSMIDGKKVYLEQRSRKTIQLVLK